MKNLISIVKETFLVCTMIGLGVGIWSCGESDPEVTVTQPDPPTITSIAPTSGPVGTVVTITGTGYGTTTADVKVSFNGTDATVTASTETSITTTVPENATTGTMTIYIGTTLIQSTPTFTVTDLPAPTVTSYDPSSALVGATVTITGADFSTVPTDNVVSFNGGVATVTSATETTLVTTLPDDATTGTVTVTIDGRSGFGPVFTVLVATPTVVSYDPVSASEGATVIITGTNFSMIAADNAVSFNGTAAVVTESTTSTITTTVPVAATTGAITVTVNDLLATGPEFTVEASEDLVFTKSVAGGLDIYLNKVQFADASTVYIAGDDDYVFKSTDAGETWTVLTSIGVQDVNYENLFFLDANTGWVVGDDGVIMKTTDGGTTWTSQTDEAVTEETLRSIYFLDANNGYVGGSGGVIIHTTDGGATWTTQMSDLVTLDSRVYDIYFIDANNGIAASEEGNIITTTNGGTAWLLQSDVNGEQESWKSVQFADANNGWIVGSAGYIYHTTNGGTSWTAQTSPSDADYNDLILIDNQTLIAVGDHNDAGDITSIVSKTTDGGATWERINHGLTSLDDDIELNGVSSFDGSVIIAIGEAGVILK